MITALDLRKTHLLFHKSLYFSSDHLQVYSSLTILRDSQHLLSKLVLVGGVLDLVELVVINVVIAGVAPDGQVTEAQGQLVVCNGWTVSQI